MPYFVSEDSNTGPKPSVADPNWSLPYIYSGWYWNNPLPRNEPHPVVSKTGRNRYDVRPMPLPFGESGPPSRSAPPCHRAGES